jgi:NAD(P)-dependent dehydrogenase (short-subunit alcohol dehydrogenase family)
MTQTTKNSRTVSFTGASSGMGKETAKELLAAATLHTPRHDVPRRWGAFTDGSLAGGYR